MIDVIIPTYNNAQTLERTLESVARQVNFEELSVFIVDDASRDESHEIALHWANRYRNVRVERNETNLGVMGNYRRLLKLGRSKYVAPIEGDDLWTSNLRLLKLSSYLEATGRPACFSGFMIENKIDGSLLTNLAMSSPRYRRFSAFDLLRDNLPASFSNCFYRRDAFEAILADPISSKGYDWLVNTLLAAGHDGLDFVPEVLSSYQVSMTGAWSSLTADRKRAMMITTLEALRDRLPPRISSTVDERMQAL